MLTAQIAATTTELTAKVTNNSGVEVKQEGTTQAAASIATSPNPQSAKKEVTKEVKAEINKVSFIVYITRSPAQFHFSFHIGTLRPPPSSRSTRKHQLIFRQPTQPRPKPSRPIDIDINILRARLELRLRSVQIRARPPLRTQLPQQQSAAQQPAPVRQYKPLELLDFCFDAAITGRTEDVVPGPGFTNRRLHRTSVPLPVPAPTTK